MTADMISTLAVGVALLGLVWRMNYTLRRDLDGKIDKLASDVSEIKERLAHIEGWIQGRFREGAEA